MLFIWTLLLMCYSTRQWHPACLCWSCFHFELWWKFQMWFLLLIPSVGFFLYSNFTLVSMKSVEETLRKLTTKEISGIAVPEDFLFISVFAFISIWIPSCPHLSVPLEPSYFITTQIVLLLKLSNGSLVLHPPRHTYLPPQLIIIILSV